MAISASSPKPGKSSGPPSTKGLDRVVRVPDDDEDDYDRDNEREKGQEPGQGPANDVTLDSLDGSQDEQNPTPVEWTIAPATLVGDKCLDGA